VTVSRTAERHLPAGPTLSRLTATVVCGQTGGLPDDCYPSYSTDLRLAFEALDAFLAVNKGVSVTIEYPLPEVWIRRQGEEFSAGWVPVAYVAGDSLPASICSALLRALGVLGPDGLLVE
jgi:hypothetical protein